MSDSSGILKFYAWLASTNPEVKLTPQQIKFVNAFFDIGKRGAGKSFILNLLREFDTHGQFAIDEPSSDRLEEFIDLITLQNPFLASEYIQALRNLTRLDFAELFLNKYKKLDRGQL